MVDEAVVVDQVANFLWELLECRHRVWMEE